MNIVKTKPCSVRLNLLGGVGIHIAVELSHRPSVHLLVRMSDNGVGSGIYKETVAGFAVLIMIVLIIILVRNIIGKPVAELNNVASRIAEGDLDQSITHSSNDELGELASNFGRTVTRMTLPSSRSSALLLILCTCRHCKD